MKGTVVTKQVLRLLFWESTIRCNLTCSHCRRLESDEAADTDLSTAQAKALIEQLAELGGQQPMMPVLVFSGGEPLCREDIFELVEYAKSLGIVPALATNGTLMDSQVAEKIADSGIARVSVSLDGATAEVHNKLRRLKGSFEKALEGINHIRDKKVPFQINITLTKHNASQLVDIYELAKSLGAVAVHIFMLVPVGCGQSLAETDMLSPEQYEQKLLEICRLDGRGEL
ncbi:MAG: radical SAM protein, partial [Planctomycetota bacterium]